MFTGIISHIAKVKSIRGNTLVFEADKSLAKKLKKGDSIAVDGVCLTIEQKLGVGPLIQVAVMPETLRRTALGNLKKGDLVNFELPLSISGRFDGHIVQGHVDGMAEIADIKKEGDSHLFTFKVSKRLGRYIVEKGSIAVNGISLTVIDANDKTFTVGIIPYTWKHTILSGAKVGDKVNVEVDILAKYLEKLEKAYHA